VFYCLVHTAAIIGTTVELAVSPPIALALRAADTAGTPLIGIAGGDEFEVFTRALRITLETVQQVARGHPALTRSG
jgi:FdhD protein